MAIDSKLPKLDVEDQQYMEEQMVVDQIGYDE